MVGTDGVAFGSVDATGQFINQAGQVVGKLGNPVAATTQAATQGVGQPIASRERRRSTWRSAQRHQPTAAHGRSTDTTVSTVGRARTKKPGFVEVHDEPDLRLIPIPQIPATGSAFRMGSQLTIEAITAGVIASSLAHINNRNSSKLLGNCHRNPNLQGCHTRSIGLVSGECDG